MPVSAIVVGVLIMSIAGHYVVPVILERLRSQMAPPDICGNPVVNEKWQGLIRHRDPGGLWVGHAERLVFFTSILVAEWEVAAVWIAFKVAAKWEAWSNIMKVPDKLPGVEELQFALGRRVWAAREYATYVVGTALNGGIAAGGFGVARTYLKIA